MPDFELEPEITRKLLQTFKKGDMWLAQTLKDEHWTGAKKEMSQ